MKTQFAMKYVVLFIALLWAFVGRSQGTIESCRAMGLYFCTECEDTDFQCELCASGYTLTSNKTGCLKCPTNCAKCTLDQAADDKCTKCVTGYVVDSSTDKCVSCSQVENCETCNVSSGKVTCTGCKTGFVFNGTICVACSGLDNCDKCTVSSDTVTCTECKTGFGLNGTICIACSGLDNCDKCTVSSDTVTCIECMTGFSLNGSTCHNCSSVYSNCLTCSSTDGETFTCDSCYPGYSKTNKECIACPTNCAKCSTNTACDTCEDGYYVDSENVCQKCFTDCATCTSKTTCTQCVTGKGTPADNATCTDCAILTEISNCATCVGATSDTAAKCVSCTTGYTISDDAKTCISTSNFGTECVGVSFKPPSCSVCQEGVGAELVSDKCLVNCYTCGNLTNNVPTSNVTQCNSQGNVYPDKVPCEYGCYIAIKYSDSQMIFASRGCVVNATCLSDGVEQCSNTGPNQNCFKCCNSGELCNGDYWDPSSAAVSHVIGIITTSVTILAAYVFN